MLAALAAALIDVLAVGLAVAGCCIIFSWQYSTSSDATMSPAGQDSTAVRAAVNTFSLFSA